MPMFTEVDPWRDEDHWPKNLEDLATPGEGAPPGHNGCTPENEGAGGGMSQRGGPPASPLCRLLKAAGRASITDLCSCYPGTCAQFDKENA